MRVAVDKKPKRGGGRKPDVSNDTHLIAQARYGLKTRKYRSILHAATTLAPKARVLIEGKIRKKAMSEQTVIARLRHGISAALKDRDPNTPVNKRYAQLIQNALRVLLK